MEKASRYALIYRDHERTVFLAPPVSGGNEYKLVENELEALVFDKKEDAFDYYDEVLHEADQENVEVFDLMLMEVIRRVSPTEEHLYTPLRKAKSQWEAAEQVDLERKPGESFADYWHRVRSELGYKTPENKDASISKSSTNPDHYQSDKMQAIDVIEAFGLGFDLGNAVKYILRCYKKDDPEKELRKAIWYIMHDLGWRPQNNQKMAEIFLTNERLAFIKKVVNLLRKKDSYSKTDANLYADELERLFELSD